MPLDARFKQVLSAAADGADWAWAELYRDLAPTLLRFLAAQGAREPEDLLGEVFIHIVRGVGAFKGEEPEFRAWAFRIARSRLVDAWRRQGRRPTIAEDDPVRASDDLLSDQPADAGVLQRAAVEEILDTLTVDQRAVLVLRYVNQLSVEETARVLDKGAGAVRVLQHRALRSLRRTLDARRSGGAQAGPRTVRPPEADGGSAFGRPGWFLVS